MRDEERIARIEHVLCAVGLDALACALPTNVLLLSGYWPVVGTAIAIATRGGRIAVLAPEDERDLAVRGWPDVLETFSPGSLDAIRRAGDVVVDPLARAFGALGLASGRARIGYERGECLEPGSYVSLHLYGATLQALLETALPHVTLAPADEALTLLRERKTARERECIARSCRAAQTAFVDGAREVRTGMTELEAASSFRAPLSTRVPHAIRADGFAFCMSGPNAARAYAAYARSTARPLARGELALVHCNSYVDGFWTDITRTYCLGEPGPRERDMYAAVLEARAAALDAVRPGVRAQIVDAVARDVLRRRGFAGACKHAIGHGVGFAAIDHYAHPRIHPRSTELLQPGMVFNIEPAIYLDGTTGLRHCDVVSLTERGPEVLTEFQGEMDDLVTE